MFQINVIFGKCDIFLGNIVHGLLAKGQSDHQLTSNLINIRSSKSERLQNDKFALFSIIWNRVIENCKTCYIPYENTTTDEQLFPTKSRYPLNIFLASQKNLEYNFGSAVDSKTTYLLAGFPYVGKDAHRPANRSVDLLFVQFILVQPVFIQSISTNPNLI